MLTILYVGLQDDEQHCGYCNSDIGYKSLGMFVVSEMDPVTFQMLMDRNWRRCSSYFYKPIIGEILYSIRLPVWDFKYSFSQKKVLRRVRRYLNGEWNDDLPVAGGWIDVLDGISEVHVPKEVQSEYLKDTSHLKLGRVVHELKGTKRTLIVTEYPARFSNEAYELYKRYQIGIHKDPPMKLTKSQYDRFLCSGPLEFRPAADGDEGYGQFHWEYRINGRLVAVGVLDKTKKSFSSVYAFYEPKYEFLSLGTFTALTEIAHLREKTNLPYYYMGFWIPECRKMVYKANFRPSQLLCPTNFNFVPLEEASVIIARENKKAIRLESKNESEENSTANGWKRESGDIYETQMLVEGDIVMPLRRAISLLSSVNIGLSEDFLIRLQEWLTAAGPAGSRCVYRMSHRDFVYAEY